jgi:uncharacterized protein YjbJ (UPF0337 family)
MNKHEMSGKWHEFSGKVKAKWGQITDDEMAQTEGRMEELAGKIQAKYGGTKEQIMRDLHDL